MEVPVQCSEETGLISVCLLCRGHFFGILPDIVGGRINFRASVLFRIALEETFYLSAFDRRYAGNVPYAGNFA